VNGPLIILNRAPLEKGASLQSLCKAPVDEPPTKFPSGAPTESDVRHLSPPPHIFPDPHKGALQLSLKILSQRTSQVHQRVPTGRDPISRVFFYTFPSKSPVNEPPSMFPNRVPAEREALSPEPMVYSFVYICHIPK